MLQCLELKGFLPDISFKLALSIKHVVLWQEKSDDRGGQRVCVWGGGVIYVILNLPDPTLVLMTKLGIPFFSVL